MELQQIRYYLALCEEQNFTRAAKKCGVRQPSLSNAIARLEAIVGGPLFVRSHPVRLSTLGAELLPLFAQISELAERARSVAGRRSQTLEGGTFSINGVVRCG